MNTLQTLLPILLLVGLGTALARIRFLGDSFMADLNKLAFWVALPALLFRSVVHAETPGPQTFHLLGTMLCGTVLVGAAGWVAGMFLRLPAASYGTLAQSAFRGNLAFIGVPVLAYTFASEPNGKESFATGVIVMALLMAAAAEVPEIMQTPPPRVVFKGVSDTAMNFTLLAWVSTVDLGTQAQNAMRVAMVKKLEGAGIGPFSARPVEIRPSFDHPSKGTS